MCWWQKSPIPKLQLYTCRDWSSFMLVKRASGHTLIFCRCHTSKILNQCKCTNMLDGYGNAKENDEHDHETHNWYILNSFMNKKHIGFLNLFFDFHNHIWLHICVTELCMRMTQMLKWLHVMMENKYLIPYVEGWRSEIWFKICVTKWL